MIGGKMIETHRERLFSTAPKEQPPRKLSGKRTELSQHTLKSGRISSIRPPQEQVWCLPDESLRSQHRGGHVIRHRVWSCTFSDGL